MYHLLISTDSRLTHYSNSLVYALSMKSNNSTSVSCQDGDHRVHHHTDLRRESIGLYQTLGDSYVHTTLAVVDDR